MAIRQSRGITLGKGTPQRLEGQNGDITIRSSRKGLKLYVKESNKWHSVDLDIDLRQIASTVRRLEDEVKRLSTKTNNIPVVDKLLLREPGGTSSVAVQNKKGAVSFRSSTDGADAPVDIAKTGTVSGGSLTEGMALTVAAATHSRFTSTANDALLSVSGTATDAGDIAIGWLNGATKRWLAGFIANDTTKFYISSGTSLASPQLTIKDDGNVGLGTTSPTTTLDVEGTVSYKHTTITTSSDAINVSATTVLECDTSGGHIRVGGFSGGVQGQIVHVLKSTGDAYRVIVEHDETPTAGVSQRIFTSGASDITIATKGGITCYCTGSEWVALDK